MRVCHVISGDLWAGAEQMCLRLLSGLCAVDGISLCAVLLNEGKLAGEIRSLGVPTVVLDERRLGFVRLVRGMRRFLAEVRPDLLHTHRLKENVLGYLASRNVAGAAPPLVCTQHGLDEPQSGMKWRVLSRAHYHVLSRRFRKVVAVSQDIREVLGAKYGLPAGRLVVIHNGTEVGDRVVSDRKPRPFVIGSAGRLFPVKDYAFFVDVAAAVHRRAADIRFELAGEGPEAGRLLDRVRRCGLEDAFSLRGFVEDMPEFYLGLDLFVNTSLHEGFPMSVLEAMSHGLPVIAPRDGGIREVVVDGVHGFLVRERQVERFAEKCLALYRDAALWRAMSAASRETVSREFSTARMAQRYAELYRELTPQPQGGAAS